MTTEEHDFGMVTAFKGITVRQRPSGGWRVGFTIESDFSELMDALEYQGKLMGMMRATAYYRVRCILEPERLSPREREEEEQG